MFFASLTSVIVYYLNFYIFLSLSQYHRVLKSIWSFTSTSDCFECWNRNAVMKFLHDKEDVKTEKRGLRVFLTPKNVYAEENWSFLTSFNCYAVTAEIISREEECKL